MKVNRINKKDGKITKTQVEVSEPTYNVRIRPEIYQRYVPIADKEGRSVTAQINRVLEKDLEDNVQ